MRSESFRTWSGDSDVDVELGTGATLPAWSVPTAEIGAVKIVMVPF